MPSLLITVFVIQLVCHLVLTIGSKPINDLLWQIYTRLPLQSSRDMQQQIRLRREVVRLKREMNAVSAQDEFSKWAKLRRQHDKALEEHDKKGTITTWRRGLCSPGMGSTFLRTGGFANLCFFFATTTAAAVSSARASFDTKATAIRWTCTSGLRFGLQFWHAKTPVFTYPRGWFPWYVEWLLGFPRCPYGGVSINVWSTACATVIALVGDVVVYLVQYVLQSNTGGQKAKTKQKGPGPMPIPMPVD
ncbi:Protein get1 [Cladophialophora carrionii]|uniref:Protein get1 n=1 Tax=Cladophialophora carrionii TaxID=86049 RepID=A0A1C1CRB8_9EURO|nr:Protein get1 [Cladophialophora carrionii]